MLCCPARLTAGPPQVTILEASYEEDADGWPDMPLMVGAALLPSAARAGQGSGSAVQHALRPGGRAGPAHAPVGRQRTVTVLEEVYSGAGWPPAAAGGGPQGLGAGAEGPMARDSQSLLQRASASTGAWERAPPGAPPYGGSLTAGSRRHTLTILEEVFPDEAGAAHAQQGHAVDVLGGWTSEGSDLEGAYDPSESLEGLTVRARTDTETERDEDGGGFGDLIPHTHPSTAQSGAWAQAFPDEGAGGGQLPGSRPASTMGGRSRTDTLSSLGSADSAHAAAAESAGMAQLRKMGLLVEQRHPGQGLHPFRCSPSQGDASQGPTQGAGQAPAGAWEAHDQHWPLVHQAAGRKSHSSAYLSWYRRAASVPAAVHSSALRMLDLRRVNSLPAHATRVLAADPLEVHGMVLQGRRGSAPMRAADSAAGALLLQRSESEPLPVERCAAGSAEDRNPGAALQHSGAAAHNLNDGRAAAGEAGGVREASRMHARLAPPAGAAAPMSCVGTQADRHACSVYHWTRHTFMALEHHLDC